MLALLYALRALAFVLFLALPLTWVFRPYVRRGAGLSLARHRSADQRTGGLHVRAGAHVDAVGIVFFSHQLGSFLGGWGAGRLYDIQGNYDVMWWISDRAWRIRGGDPLAHSRATGRAARARTGAVMNQVAGSAADNAAKRPPRLMLWFVGGIGFAVSAWCFCYGA